MEVLVVGAGEMGRWFGQALASDADEAVSLTFADADPAVAAATAESLSGDTVGDPTDAEADVVAVAVPIQAVETTIETWAPIASDAVVDVTGTMAGPLDAMRTHAPDRQRASLHPLFAPANEPGNVAIVTDADGPRVESISAALRSRGNALYETTAAEHDEAMATVQTKAHAAILAYALAAQSVPAELHTPISSELTALADQVTNGDARVYADIQAAFDGAGEVAAAANEIAAADEETFGELYDRAGR